MTSHPPASPSMPSVALPPGYVECVKSSKAQIVSHLGRGWTCLACENEEALGVASKPPVAARRADGFALTIELPHPPSVNHYWRHVGAKILVSREGREYRKRVADLLAGTTPMNGPLSVIVDVHPPDRRRRDLDNVLKSLLDAMQHGGAYGDDSQVAQLLVTRRDPTPGGKAVVRIEDINTSGAAIRAALALGGAK